MRWTSALVVALMLVTGCSSGPSDEPGDLRTFGAGDSFTIPRAGGGICSFDHRSQVHRVDPASGIEWSVDVPWVGRGDALVVHYDQVFGVSRRLSDADVVYAFALDATSGEPRWQRAVDHEWTPLHVPLPSADIVVVGDGQSVVGLDTGSGTEVWRVAAQRASAMIDEGLLIVSEGGPLVLIDPATGTLRRELPFDTSNDRLSIHVAGELMIVGDGRGEIAAFDLAAAEIRWRHEVNLNDATSYEVDIVDDTVVVNHLRATVGEIAALDLETGELLWERSVRDERRLLTELRDLVVDRATLDVIDADTGDELWRIDPTSLDAEAPPDHASRVSQPMSGLVVAALPYETEEQDPDTGWVSTRDLTKLVAFTAQDGSVRWQLDRHDGHLSPATLVDDRLIVGGGRESRTADGDDVDEGSLMAVDPTSGLIEWEAELRDEVAAAPIPVGDRATVLSSDSAMFCE